MAQSKYAFEFGFRIPSQSPQINQFICFKLNLSLTLITSGYVLIL